MWYIQEKKKSLEKLTLEQPVRENSHALELYLIMSATEQSLSEMEAANGIITNSWIFLKFIFQQPLEWAWKISFQADLYLSWVIRKQAQTCM